MKVIVLGAGVTGITTAWFLRQQGHEVTVVDRNAGAEGYKNITLPLVLSTCGRLLGEQESTFFQYRNLLTAAQWQLLKAIAKEDKLYQPNSMHFLTTHKIGTASHVQRGLEALLTKEMIYTEKDERGNYYSVYDCFLSRWLKLAID